MSKRAPPTHGGCAAPAEKRQRGGTLAAGGDGGGGGGGCGGGGAALPAMAAPLAQRTEVEQQALDKRLHQSVTWGAGPDAKIAAEVRALLLQGARPDGFRGLFGNSALHRASYDGRPETVRVLLQATPRPGDIEAKNCYERTPLIEAAEYGRTEVVRVLLGSGANPGATCERGKNAMDYANDGGKHAIVALLEAFTSRRCKPAPKVPKKLQKQQQANKVQPNEAKPKPKQQKQPKAPKKGAQAAASGGVKAQEGPGAANNGAMAAAPMAPLGAGAMHGGFGAGFGEVWEGAAAEAGGGGMRLGLTAYMPPPQGSPGVLSPALGGGGTADDFGALGDFSFAGFAGPSVSTTSASPTSFLSASPPRMQSPSGGAAGSGSASGRGGPSSLPSAALFRIGSSSSPPLPVDLGASASSSSSNLTHSAAPSGLPQ